MKSDRRHELQTNELANWIGRQYERHQGHLPTVLWGALAIVAVIVLIGVWGSRSSNSVAGRWEEYYQVSNADPKVRSKRLEALAEKYPDTEIALWARLDLADQLCSDGHAKLEFERETATTYLSKAQKTYAVVLQDSKAVPDMVRRAALAEAKCWELMGDREHAIESYKAVAKRFANSHPELSADAASRASELEQPEAADFYKWLAEYTPPASRLPNLPGMGALFPPVDDPTNKSNGADDSTAPAKQEATTDATDSVEKKSSEDKPKTELESAPPAPDSKSDEKPASKEKAPDPDAATPKPDDEKKPPEPADTK